jgi:CubicO group peptidase (beta-lactamase class C family)/imidazolonepropionase-like amidohydrolase
VSIVRSPGLSAETIVKPLILLVALAVGCTHSFAPPWPPRGADPVVVFTDVTVVPMTGGPELAHVNVVVRGDHIERVDAEPPPSSARVIDGRGRYLMPGMADMHVHLPVDGSDDELERVAVLSLLGGVTTVRGMQGAASHLAFRARAKGPVPELFLAGPPIAESLTPDEARARVREQKRAGYDLIKVLGGFDRATYDAIVDEARREKIPVVGHVPAEVGIDAALAGQVTIEHLMGYGDAAKAGDPALAALAARTRDAHVWNCPTLDYFETSTQPDLDELDGREGLEYASARDREAWGKQDPPPKGAHDRMKDLRREVLALQRAGAGLLVGSDAPGPYVVPGFGYHEELRQLVRAGLTAEEVLTAATRNAAAALGRDPRDGTIQPGAIADLVLVSADPLAGVEHVAHPEIVMVRGQAWTRGDLLARLGAPAPVDPSGRWDLRWERGFARDPRVLEGSLDIQRGEGGFTATLSIVFDPSEAQPTQLRFESLRVERNQIDLAFTDPESGEPFGMSATIAGNRLVGEAYVRAGGERTAIGGRRFPSTELRPGHVEHSLPAFESGRSGIDQAGLATLLEHARAEESSAIVIVKDGKIAVESYRDEYDGSPLVAMSGSKSFVSLAIGMLIDEGKLTLDTTMGSLFPEWRTQGKKAGITVRMLLNHTSGLEPTRARFDGKATIRGSMEHAKLLTPPGTRFQYNNAGIDFLAVVVRQVAGVPLDEYLDAHLFKKIDAVGVSWMKDPEGTPRGAGELFIRPVDFAKVGQIMLDGGRWRGETIVSPGWVAASAAVSQPFEADYGLLWWREGTFAYALTEPILAWWAEVGVDAKTIQAARPLVGKKHKDKAEHRAAVQAAVGKVAFDQLTTTLFKADHVPLEAAIADGPVIGFAAKGWLGQYMVVYPDLGVVAVRMRQAVYSDYLHKEKQQHLYEAFPGDAAKLFPRAP